QSAFNSQQNQAMSNQENGQEQNNDGKLTKLSFTETAVLEVNPDLLVIGFYIQTLETNASYSAERNAFIYSSIKEKLKSIGIDEKSIQTEQYTINPYYEYIYLNNEQKTVFKGYMTTHTLSVMVNNITLAGKVIDAIASFDNTSISYINYKLTNDLEEQKKEEALKIAISNAENKAKLVAKEINKEVVNIKEMSVSSGLAYPIPIYYAKSPYGPYLSQAAETQIETKKVKITASVSMVVTLN
ncbi:MAG: SIMPL domain-containing protein, partial [Candidatus Anstonellales archaeon]